VRACGLALLLGRTRKPLPPLHMPAEAVVTPTRRGGEGVRPELVPDATRSPTLLACETRYSSLLHLDVTPSFPPPSAAPSLVAVTSPPSTVCSLWLQLSTGRRIFSSF
jgi:hypothetical protein